MMHLHCVGWLAFRLSWILSDYEVSVRTGQVQSPPRPSLSWQSWYHCHWRNLVLALQTRKTQVITQSDSRVLSPNWKQKYNISLRKKKREIFFNRVLWLVLPFGFETSNSWLVLHWFFNHISYPFEERIYYIRFHWSSQNYHDYFSVHINS